MAHANTSFALSEPEFEMVKHIIDIPDLEDFKLSEYSIYKVPCNLRKVKEEAYTPQLISIGPIHLDKEELKPMQEHKKRYFHFFWERVSNEQTMKDYKHYLETQEQEIRRCYAHKIREISKEKFMDMMLLDAVFIMELFLRNSSCKSDTFKHEHELKHSDDYILTQPLLSKDIARDLILIENQIPIFVLKELYDTVFPDVDKRKKHPCFVDLALKYLKEFYDTQRSSSGETKLVLDKNPKHFTDLIRCFYLPADMGNRATKLQKDSFLRTATKLNEAGISFEKVDNRCLLDIKFKKSFLSWFLCLGCLPHSKCFKARFLFPKLKVDHTTECVLRNLIALEQCHYPEKPYICNYVFLVDSLIHTKDDAELLVEKEAIVHELGSDKELANLVNSLCKHVVTNSNCYHKIIKDIDKHYNNKWKWAMGTFRMVYFRDPWRSSSTVVGIAVLIFTIFNFCRVIRLIF